jgi:hypothetical protein
MKVADQLEETWFVFDDDGLIPVVEEMAHPMAPVEDLRAPGKERAHRMGPKARDEVRPVGIVPEESGPLAPPPHHHVVQGVRRIEPRLAGQSTAGSTTRRKRCIALCPEIGRGRAVEEIGRLGA